MKSPENAVLSPAAHAPGLKQLYLHIRRETKRIREKHMNDEISNVDLILPLHGIGDAYLAAASARRAIAAFLTGKQKKGAKHLLELIHNFMDTCDHLVGQDLEQQNYLFGLGVGAKGAEALKETGERIKHLEWAKVELRDKSLYLWAEDPEGDEDDEAEEAVTNQKN